MCVLIVSPSGLCWPKDNEYPLRVMASSCPGELGPRDYEEKRQWLSYGYIFSPRGGVATVYVDLKEAENIKRSSTEKISDLPAISDDALFGILRDMPNPRDKAIEELIARYESAKRDLNDFSEI